jgi:putative phosphoesterase
MKIALLADIHGNSLALDAVLADIQMRGGVDNYWILGDLCAIGYDPAGVLERLTALPNAVFVRGNVDRFVTTGERPDPDVQHARENPAAIPVLAEVAGSFGWTQGYLEATGWLDWLRNLPLERQIQMPNGKRVLLVHAAPGKDDGWGLNPSLTDDELALEIMGCDADLICVGHFHMPMHWHFNGVQIVNPGAVSNAFPPDLRAAYAILTTSSAGNSVDFYRVEYDLATAILKARACSNPGAGYFIQFYEGKVRASWLARWDGISHYPPIISS